MRLKDQVAWVTGASSGIGRESALALAREGAKVAVSARRTDRLETLAADIEALGSEAMPVACDVTDEDAIERAVGAVVDRFGKLDLALANAGYAVSGPVEKLTAEEWRRQLDVNVVGTALTAKHALGPLRKTGGRIGLVCSVASYICPPKMAAYAASKHAVRALGQTLSAELHGSGVSCTTVHPGYVESEIEQVDSLGGRDPSREDRRPKHLVWPTDKAAAVIVDAIIKRKRELVFTAHGKFGAFIGQHMPAVAHLMMRRG